MGYIPDLGRNGVNTVPIHHAQNTQPGLGPVRAVDGTAKFVQKATSFDHARVILADTHKPESHVVHACAKNGAVGFNVQTPATILGMLTSKEIALDLRGVLWGDGSVGHIPGDQQPRQQKHGTTILASPVARLELQVGEERQAILCGFDRPLGLWQIWEALRSMSALIQPKLDSDPYCRHAQMILISG